MNFWHISDTHLSFDKDWNVLKKMHERRWATGAWTYTGYLERMADFGTQVIKPEDFVAITGDIVHDMGEQLVPQSLRWLRHHIKGTIILCRGNHDKKWDVGSMRLKVSDLPNFYLIDEGEIHTIGPYTIGCFSNHSEKTQDFNNTDGRYLEMAINIVKQAKAKNRIPVMMSHYPVNLSAALAIGSTGLKAYMSGHIHCTDSATAGKDHPLNWEWYNLSAAQTDDKILNGCFFSTATTDVVQARHNQSFKEIKVLAPGEQAAKPPVRKTAQMIVLCGIPGSGKSTVAKLLEDEGFVRVNQDELGSRNACKRIAEEALKQDKSVVIDRCNFNANQRKSWIDLAHDRGIANIRCVWLDISPDTCLSRAEKRTNHLTIEDPEEAYKAIIAINSMFVSPRYEEGFTKVTIYSADSLMAANEIVADIKVTSDAT